MVLVGGHVLDLGHDDEEVRNDDGFRMLLKSSCPDLLVIWDGAEELEREVKSASKR